MSPCAPQDIKVLVEHTSCDGESQINMKLVAGNSVDNFNWADWIDAAMGYMEGEDALITTEHEINWRKRTPSKCDLRTPLLVIPKEHPEQSDLPGDIRMWTGWPIFDIKVVQFEMNQWMDVTVRNRIFENIRDKCRKT